MQPAISVIIPTYNRERLLQRAIQSVLAQTYANFEIFVYDNASEDDTKKVVAEFAAKDSRIHYFRHQANIGMMPNYAFAFERVKTRYFSILSDDDYMCPWLLEEALTHFEKYPDIGFCACSTLVVNERYEFNGDPSGVWLRFGYYSCPEGALAMANGFLLPPGIVFQSEKALAIKPDLRPDIQSRWDSDFILRIACEYPFVISERPSAVFFANSEGFSTSFFGDAQKNVAAVARYRSAMRAMLANIRQNERIDSDFKKSLIAQLSGFFAWETMHYIILMLRQRKYAMIADYLKLSEEFPTNSRRIRLMRVCCKIALALPSSGPILRFLFFMLTVANYLLHPRMILQLPKMRKPPTWHQEAQTNSLYSEIFAWRMSEAAKYTFVR